MNVFSLIVDEFRTSHLIILYIFEANNRLSIELFFLFKSMLGFRYNKNTDRGNAVGKIACLFKFV